MPIVPLQCVSSGRRVAPGRGCTALSWQTLSDCRSGRQPLLSLFTLKNGQGGKGLRELSGSGGDVFCHRCVVVLVTSVYVCEHSTNCTLKNGCILRVQSLFQWHSFKQKMGVRGEGKLAGNRAGQYTPSFVRWASGTPASSGLVPRAPLSPRPLSVLPLRPQGRPGGSGTAAAGPGSLAIAPRSPGSPGCGPPGRQGVRHGVAPRPALPGVAGGHPGIPGRVRRNPAGAPPRRRADLPASPPRFPPSAGVGFLRARSRCHSSRRRRPAPWSWGRLSPASFVVASGQRWHPKGQARRPPWWPRITPSTSWSRGPTAAWRYPRRAVRPRTPR